VLLDGTIILGFSLKVETYKAMADTQLSTDMMDDMYQLFATI
jgi:hypothetical protein